MSHPKLDRPKFFPRAQVTGVVRWPCVFCGHINTHYWRPTASKFKCRQRNCGRITQFSTAQHVYATGSVTGKLPYDATIPSWTDDEYIWDAIPESIWDNKPLKAGSRMHLLIIHDNILLSSDPIPPTLEGKEVLPAVTVQNRDDEDEERDNSSEERGVD